MAAMNCDVRFTPESGLFVVVAECPLSANSDQILRRSEMTIGAIKNGN
jgi:hypothetical protein